MPLITYVKEDTFKKRQFTKRRERTFFGLIAFLGLVCMILAIWPFLMWQFNTLPRLSSKISFYPIPQSKILSEEKILASNVQVVADPDGFSYFTTTYKPEGPRPIEFFLIIPKLKIEKARVRVDSLKFDMSLAHFPGSVLPGEVGNSFITGHSVLPEFADSKNYRTIFTKLPELEVGDDVFVEIEGRTLHFGVQYAKVVNPQDLSVLLPISAGGRNLTLMTCVPPGTSIKRLVVITGLI